MYPIRSLAGYQTLVDIGLGIITDFFVRTLQGHFKKPYERFSRFYRYVYQPFRAKHIDNVELKEH